MSRNSLSGILLIWVVCSSCVDLVKYLDQKVNSTQIKFLSKESDYLILFGDIQHYTESDNWVEYYNADLKWINKASDEGYSIKGVLLTGDLTQDNALPQWQRFSEASKTLYSSIPMISAIGNHDYEQNAKVRSSYFSQYMKYMNNLYYEASYSIGEFENSFFKFEMCGKDFFIITLEFGVRNDKLFWADSIARSNPDAFGIVLTHAHLFKRSELFDKEVVGQNVQPWLFLMNNKVHVNDGIEVWKKLISPNDNLKMILSGHKTVPDWNAFSLFANNAGNNVLHVLFNPEDQPKGGDGWITLLEFKKGTNEIHCTLYSPILDSFYPLTEMDEPVNSFIFNY